MGKMGFFNNRRVRAPYENEIESKISMVEETKLSAVCGNRDMVRARYVSELIRRD